MTSASAAALSGGIFDLDAKARRLSEVREALQDPAVWNDPARAQALGKEQSDLEEVVTRIEKIDRALDDSTGLLDLAEEENDHGTVEEVVRDLEVITSDVEELEFGRMFSGTHDSSNAFLDVQPGGGPKPRTGRHAAAHVPESTRSTAFRREDVHRPARWPNKKRHRPGWRNGYDGGTETRAPLVRKSTFDSENAGTSLRSRFVSPELDDDIEIEIDSRPSD